MSSDGNEGGAGDPGSPSLRSDGPPPAQPAAVSADQLRNSHPLWQRAAGRAVPLPNGGGGPRGGRGGGSQQGDKPRFAPLSALALELDGFRANADGDSALFSESGKDSLAQAPSRKRKGKGKASAQVEDDEEEDGEGAGFSELHSSDDDERLFGSKKKQKRKANKEGGGSGDNAAMYAAAAFGGAYAGDESDAGSVSQMSGTSSQRRKDAYKAAFPIKGIDCVGCALVKKIAPVEKFIKVSASLLVLVSVCVSDEGVWHVRRTTWSEWQKRRCGRWRRSPTCARFRSRASVRVS